MCVCVCTRVFLHVRLSQCVLSRPVSPSHLYLNDATMTPSVTRSPGQKIKNEKDTQSEHREQKQWCDEIEGEGKIPGILDKINKTKRM